MSRKLKVLAVDDNSISLATIEQELSDTYEVIPLNSGLRALQYLRRERPDLILLDIRMELIDGIATLQEIRNMERCKNVPVIMLILLSLVKIFLFWISLHSFLALLLPFGFLTNSHFPVGWNLTHIYYVF